MLKPDGSLLEMQPWLQKLLFPNFFIPGLVLFIFNGLLPTVVVFGLFFKPELTLFNKLNVYPNMHWSWAFSLYWGIIILFWIIIQQFLTTFFILQPAVALCGLSILIFRLLPRIINHQLL